MTNKDILKRAISVAFTPAMWLTAILSTGYITGVIGILEDYLSLLQLHLPHVAISIMKISQITLRLTDYLVVIHATAALIFQIARILADQPIGFRAAMRGVRSKRGALTWLEIRVLMWPTIPLLMLVVAVVMLISILTPNLSVFSMWYVIPIVVITLLGLSVVDLYVDIVTIMMIMEDKPRGESERAASKWLSVNRKTVLWFFVVMLLITIPVSLISNVPNILVRGNSVFDRLGLNLAIPIADQLIWRFVTYNLAVIIGALIEIFYYTAWMLFYRRLQGSSVSV